MINFFVKKKKPDNNPITFSGTKIDKKQQHSKIYFLDPKYHYKAGNEFEEFCTNFRLANSLKFTYYLKNEDLIGNQGKFQISVIDSNNFNGNEYKILKISINEKLYKKITGNPLWIRTVDTGTFNGRAGIYEIHDTFSVNGILVTKATYRTHPIQLFFTPQLNRKDLTLLLKYFNIILEFLRDKYDSEFLTTYKYSNGPYTRKYLGLSQVRKLINTFPIKLLNINEKNRFEEILLENEVEELIRFLKTIKKNDKNAL